MAIYRFSAAIISRAKGRSSVAAAAYRSGSQLADERTGAVHDYTRKSDIQHSEILAPEGAPDWSLDRAALWNAVEAGERRKDAQLAREVQLALPRELNADRQIALLRGFVRSEFVARGMVADFSLHDHVGSDGQAQPHAHVMLTMRSINETGFGPKMREWNSDELLVHWREQWAHQANTQLAEAGEEVRIDHRTLAAQRAEAQAHASAEPEGERRDALEVRAAGMDREPSPYLRASWYMEQKARAAAEAAGLTYEPITDRGGWLAEVRTLAAERLEAVKAFAHELAQRAAQTWRHWMGQEHEKPVESDAGSEAVDRLRRGREVAQGSQPSQPDAGPSSAAELLRRASQVAHAAQAEGTSAGIDRLYRGREINLEATRTSLRGQWSDDQEQG
ncbi:MobQ family relaxase [Sphingomonas xinjiangensis]|uniref:ATP-dependent exoDNAse (Exonuclease V) alpha subunit n=1 Tax=Sphingomonas xinjiangensis TaxID=643568 RepID=A0A840YSW4_9SPHN|nr:MobQ family relaxase [Sphingomonas xinjiangensis]MBB5712786.1 ATP-dependent exoDNAse (exonuclease V) alpha subunit [Sphingomonas xinjiangensis]